MIKLVMIKTVLLLFQNKLLIIRSLNGYAVFLFDTIVVVFDTHEVRMFRYGIVIDRYNISQLIT